MKERANTHRQNNASLEKHLQQTRQRRENLEEQHREGVENLLESKMARAQEVLEHHRSYEQAVLESKKNTRDRRVLRSKIQNLLQFHCPMQCKHFKTKKNRVDLLRRRLSREKSSAACKKASIHASTDVLLPALPETSGNVKNAFSPDEALIEFCTEEELQLVLEDPKYFIPDENMRKRLTLVDEEADLSEED